jgi:hypothetical protein
MSSDETIKIEPTLTVSDAPARTSEKPLEANSEVLKVEVPRVETAKSEPEAPKLPEAPRLSESKIEITPPKAEIRFEAKQSEPKPERKADTVIDIPALRPAAGDTKFPGPEVTAKKPSGASRFALLAACIAIAASFGAVGGSLGVAKFGPMLTSAPPPVAPVAKEHVAEEVRALKESVAQLRATTRSLSDNLASLKTTANTASTQNGRIAETLDRIEKAQAESRKAATAAAVIPPPTPAPVPPAAQQMTSTTQVSGDITGSVGQKGAAVPMVLGDPPSTLKVPTVPGWTLRRVYDGAALLEGREGVIEVEPGMVVPGLGRIESVKRQDGRWVVATSRGLVVGR